MNYNFQLRKNLEDQIISSLLNENDLYFNTMISLNDHHFKDPLNRSIYLAVQESANKFKKVDLNTVSQTLKDVSDKNTSMQDVIQKLSDSNSYNGVHYDNLAKALLEYSACDSLTEIASGILNSNKQEIDDVTSYLESLKSDFNDISTVDVPTSNSIEKDVDEAVSLIINRAKSEHTLIGLPTSVESLDDFTLGWNQPDLIIIAATPGSGKTAFAIHSHLHIGLNGHTSSYYSYEVTTNQLIERELAIISRINSKKFFKGDLTDEELHKLTETSEVVKSTTNLHHCSSLKLSKLLSSIRYDKRKHDVDIVFVDYCQLISNDMESRGATTNDLIGGISTRLKQLALELKIPIVLLSQLSRDVTKRSDKKPVLSDLRGSGSLEQDADIVMFLHRPELYGEVPENYRNDGKNLCKAYISKGRKIGLRDFDFFYDVKTNYFEDWDNGDWTDGL